MAENKEKLDISGYVYDKATDVPGAIKSGQYADPMRQLEAGVPKGKFMHKSAMEMIVAKILGVDKKNVKLWTFLKNNENWKKVADGSSVYQKQ